MNIPPEKLTKPEARVRRIEPFLLRSMGAFGYLKVPRQITERFNYDKDSVKDPEAFFSETETQAILTYVFEKTDTNRFSDTDGRASIRKPTGQEENNTPTEK